MVPREVYETFPDHEKRLWHSHEFEVKSGMLILPKPEGETDEAWEEKELKAMKEIVGLVLYAWEIEIRFSYFTDKEDIGCTVRRGTFGRQMLDTSTLLVSWNLLK